MTGMFLYGDMVVTNEEVYLVPLLVENEEPSGIEVGKAIPGEQH